MTSDLEHLTHAELVELARRQQVELARLRGDLPSALPLPPSDLPLQPLSDPEPGLPDPEESPAARLRPFLAALAALAAAAGGEFILRSQGTPLPGIVLYAVAALLLAVTSTRFVLHPFHPAARIDPLLGWIVGTGAAVGLALAILAFLTLHTSLRDPAGLWLWLASLAALTATGVAAWRVEQPSPRWRPDLPHTRRGQIGLWLAIALILVVAVAARLYALDRIPFGINPDEGDRTATAMQILRGTTDRTLFESGWYRISMMYFTLLARWLDWFGVGYVQARLFTAGFGLLSVAAVLWIGLRQWGTRVGLAAGGALALMGLALQFSRETSEAGPTAALWAISVALLLDGARTGRLLPWIGGGLAGGFSLYFYPTGRLWPLLAVLLGLYLLARWWGSGRAEYRRLMRGLALGALAAVAVAVPFFAHAFDYPDEFSLRFLETSVLRPENAARLHYVDPNWSPARLLVEQVGRSLGVFSRYPDGAGFWPMHEPVLNGVLALLVLLGLGVCALRWRDPRGIALAIWFAIGMSGMVLTVETPNVQRLATAVPALALLAAVTLDEIVRRIGRLWPVRLGVESRGRLWMSAGATGAATLLLAGALAAEVRFYFRDYAAMNLWSGWNQEGRALTMLPPDTLHMSLGGSFHMINSGWVRLLAPEAERGGVRSPGSMLPLPESGARGLSFLLYPDQAAYLPWLQGMYPGATLQEYALEDEGSYFTFLYVPAPQVAATRGARFTHAGTTRIVDTIGTVDAASDGELSGIARWEAQLRVAQAGNYTFRTASGPATLAIDGEPLVRVAEGEPGASSLISLARGDYAILLEGPASGLSVEWARVEPGQEPDYHPIDRARLTAVPGEPQGFAGTIEIEGLPVRLRQDTTLATCCLGDLLNTRNRPVRATWEADLIPWESGVWEFVLTAPGAAQLQVNEETILTIADENGGRASGTVELAEGGAALRVEVISATGANGPLELVTIPPAGDATILPGWALRRAPLVGAPLPDDTLREPDAFPVDVVLETVE